MNANDYSHFAAQLLVLITYTTLPIVLAVTLTGLAVAFFQAVTQLQDQTISLLPKLIAFGLTLYLTSAWMASSVLDFTQNMLNLLAQVR